MLLIMLCIVQKGKGPLCKKLKILCLKNTLFYLYTAQNMLWWSQSQTKSSHPKIISSFFLIDFDIFFLSWGRGGPIFQTKHKVSLRKREQKSCIRETLNLSPRNTLLTDKHHTHRGTPYSMGNNLLTTKHPT